MDRQEEAEARLHSALTLDPKQVLALLSLGELRFRQGKRQEGMTFLQRAVAANQESCDAQYRYGFAVLRRRDAVAGGRCGRRGTCRNSHG